MRPSNVPRVTLVHRIFLAAQWPDGTTKVCAVDEVVEVKSVVHSLIASRDLGKYREGKTAIDEQRLAIAANKLETIGTLRKETA